MPQETNDRELVIERIFDAPRALVFQAWTDRAHMMGWFGPRGYHATSCELDVRPGGAWRGCMRSPEGVEHCASGVYREVVPNERLVFTYAWEENGRRGHETEVRITFADHDGKTKMTFRQAPFETVESRDSHHGGWSEAFDKLGETLVS